MVLRLIRDLPGDHAWLPPSSARRASVFANLAPASERQDHTTSPSTSCHSSRDMSRPSHPAAYVRDDREAPLLWLRDGREHRCDLPDKATSRTCDRLARRAICAWHACANSFLRRCAATQKHELVIPGSALTGCPGTTSVAPASGAKRLMGKHRDHHFVKRNCKTVLAEL
jgi:hypothetical protein